MAASSTPMKYRFLGDSGLLVSQISIGSWVTFADTATVDNAYDIMSYGYENGINLWDTAEAYGDGVAEQVVGQVFHRGVENKLWTREDLVITTKLFVGKDGPNSRGLNRKHLIEGTKASLKRMQLDYVDVLFCHRPEPYTPIEETVRAMNFIINQGWAFYWGTSEWLSSEIFEACEIADRLGLIRPICEQPEYNLFERSRVEMDYDILYKKYKLGLTTWSPLKFGLLTGKYGSGIPEGSRLSMDYHLGLLKGEFEKKVQQVEQLRPIAAELDCTLAQLALAWATSNERVSTLIVGATSVKQLEENLKALDVVPKLTDDVKARIEAVIPRELKIATHDRFATIREKYLYFNSGCGSGAAEEVLGQVFHRGAENKIWEREDLVITTKLFVGTKEGPNASGLSRKHLIEGAKASLKRMQLDYVDVIFCHRPEPCTPIEETVRAMNFIIQQGWAFYWGTSEWLSSEILEACEVADRLGLIRPICEQPEYNVFERSRVEMDFVNLYKKYKFGLTTWSPLKFGLLAGKYGSGIPEGSRLSEQYRVNLLNGEFEKKVQEVEQLRPIAEELNCSLAQLALAWVTSNERVSTTIIGATSFKQLEENLKALEVVPKLTEEVKARIDSIVTYKLKLPTHEPSATHRHKYL